MLPGPHFLRPLNIRFIMQDKRSRQGDDVDHGVLQIRLHRLATV
jgi:hypothetical protein